jgi:hypothetical protein
MISSGLTRMPLGVSLNPTPSTRSTIPSSARWYITPEAAFGGQCLPESSPMTVGVSGAMTFGGGVGGCGGLRADPDRVVNQQAPRAMLSEVRTRCIPVGRRLCHALAVVANAFKHCIKSAVWCIMLRQSVIVWSRGALCGWCWFRPHQALRRTAKNRLFCLSSPPREQIKVRAAGRENHSLQQPAELAGCR